MYYPVYIRSETPGASITVSLPGIKGTVQANSIADVPEQVQALCVRRKRKMPASPLDLGAFARDQNFSGGWWFWTYIDVDG